jgi:broad specificity phosphatase PhoE
MKLLMARHGQSRWQVDGDVAGMDAPLTALGELQSHHLGEFLAQHYNVGALYSSNLQRAHRTAEIVASYVDLPHNVELDLREFDEWEAGWAPTPGSMWETAPSGEAFSPGYARFRQRVDATLRRVVEAYDAAHDPEAPLLIIAHGGTIGVILRILMGSDTPRIWAWNTALHMIEWNRPNWGQGWVIHYLNRMEHLPHFMRTA